MQGSPDFWTFWKSKIGTVPIKSRRLPNMDGVLLPFWLTGINNTKVELPKRRNFNDSAVKTPLLIYVPLVPALTRVLKSPLTVLTLPTCTLSECRPEAMVRARNRHRHEHRISDVGCVVWISVFSFLESSETKKIRNC